MNESLKTLKQVLDDLKTKGFKLFIPSYQRGYRWTSIEVSQLLDDIDDEQAGEHYFLQLLAVREENAKLRIIDGQQRLTTVLLVLDYLDDGNRSSDLVEYETRNNSGGKTLDGYFKDEARKAIETKLSGKTETEKREFAQKLIDCEFLYFPIESKDNEFDFFSRLNTWKISATDAELVKCFFLSNDDSATIEMRAIKWNQMERQLSDDQFWGVFSNHRTVRMDRMGVLLSYAIDMSDNDSGTVKRFPLFEKCKSEEKAGASRDWLWSKVEAVFSLLQKWYVNTHNRHLIGWYFHRKGSGVVKGVHDLLGEAIREAVSLVENGEWLKCPELYANGGDKLHSYLLLANVAWCSESHGVNFDFYRCSLIDPWSIEHVHARNQRNLGEDEFKGLVFNFDDGEADDSRKAELWKEYEKIGDKGAANDFLRKHLSDKCGYPEEDEDNSLGNLALLPSDANSSLNDKLFKGKQREILSWVLARDKSSYWAPPLTVAMFTKGVGEPKDKFLAYWSKPDREAYVKTVENNVKEFLNHFRRGEEK